MFEATGGIETTYRLLLGSDVMDSMQEEIGPDNARAFLKQHAKYDALVRKNPKADPMQAMEPNSIPAFKDFHSYVSFLKKIETQLRSMQEPISKAMHQTISTMIDIANTPVKKSNTDKSAKASTETVLARFGNEVFKGKSLLAIPVQMQDTKALPYSYPSWHATIELVDKFADEKQYNQRICSELTSCLRSRLVNTLESLARSKQEKDIKQLVVEAQQYLMDRNWIQYGLENVAQASYNIARAGVKHRVGTNGVIQHIDTTRTLAYAYLGVNLESILRRGCFALLKEISSNMVFAGRQASFDVLSAACSYYVQDLGRKWLNNVQAHLK